MKVAVTADLHLAAGDQHPERLNALENILAKAGDLGIGDIIIAGDLFDASSQGYAEFEAFCRYHPRTSFHLLPGNHDEKLGAVGIVTDNAVVYGKPSLVELDRESAPILFIPYRSGTDMGSAIAGVSENLQPGRWILVSHGDYREGMTEPNPLEPNVYMPLTRSDVDRFEPAMAVLGHIHKPFDGGRVCYVGSPCGLNISETGVRRFVVLDTAALTRSAHEVDTDIIYFDETFVVIPSEDELERLAGQAAERIASWGLRENQREKVRARVRVAGYSSDRQAARKVLADAFAGYEVENGFDMSRLSFSADEKLRIIAEEASALLAKTRIPAGPDHPGKDEILEEMFTTIYSEHKK